MNLYNRLRWYDKKHCLLPLTIGLLEGLVSWYSVFSNNSLFDMHKKLAQSLVMTSYEAPLMVKHKLGLLPTKKEINQAWRNPKTQVQLPALFDKDDKDLYSEVQGSVTLDGDMLRFYERPTINGRNARWLVQNVGNIKDTIDWFELNKQHYCALTGMTDNVFNSFLQGARQGNLNYYAQLVNTYFVLSDSAAFDDNQNLMDFYWNAKQIKGVLVGKFHTHNDGSPPSLQDEQSSGLERQLVLVRKSGQYLLYDLPNEEVVP